MGVQIPLWDTNFIFFRNIFKYKKSIRFYTPPTFCIFDSLSFSCAISSFTFKYWKWSEVTQLCLTLCDPVDCSPPGSSIHGISQERVLEWVALSISRRSSQPRDWTWVSRVLAWRIPWTQEPGRLESTGSQRVRHDSAHIPLVCSFCLHGCRLTATLPGIVWCHSHQE